MNSCDFSLASYNFDPVPGDYALKNFNISHDENYLLKLITAAQKITQQNQEYYRKYPLKIFGTPWSPPPWMKTNGQMDGSGTPGLIKGNETHFGSSVCKKSLALLES